jgi:hypothetical protein
MAGSSDSRVDALRPVRNPWFLFAALLFAAHYLAEKTGVKIPLIDAYLDDLLCMPVILSISLCGMRFAYGKYKLSPRQILFTLIYCSFYSRYYCRFIPLATHPTFGM